MLHTRLREHKIIAFMGYKGSGKSTAAAYVQRQIERNPVSTALTLSFAGPIKRMCAQVFGTALDVDRRFFYGSQLEKEAEIPQIPGWSGRTIMQHIGTEGFREVHKEVWAKYAVNDALQKITRGGYTHIIFDDLRFHEEANAVKTAGGIVVKITGGYTEPADTHESETTWSTIVSDRTIDNSGPVEHLYRNLNLLL